MRVLRALTSWFWNLRLVWKLLLPLVGMTLVVGLVGAFFTVRHLTDQAEIDLEEDLFRRSAAAQAAVRDLRLDLADSVHFGANIRGVPDAVGRGDGTAVREFLASVAAVHAGVDLLVATGIDGVGLVEVVRGPGGLEVGTGTRWDDPGIGADTLARAGSDAPLRTGFVRAGDTWMLATGGPVILEGQVVGTVIAGVTAPEVARSAAERAGAPVDMFDRAGGVVAGSERRTIDQPPPRGPGGAYVRRVERVNGQRMAVLYGALDLGSESVGTLAVRVPTSPAFATARGATFRLAALVVLAMAGILGLGVLLTRVILRQVEPLMETNRALGRGDLTVRAPVRGRDELGELAAGLNLMAEQLQASQAELEMRVAARTEELAHLYRQGLQVEQGRSQLFAEMVHEFRNQLFVIAGYGDLMLDADFNPGAPEWRFEYGQAITEAAGDLRTRVDEILDLARAEAGKMTFDFDEVLLADFFTGLKGTIVALARRGELTAEIDVPEKLPAVRADPRRLAQIVMNLVSNAVKYTPPGGRLRITGRRSGDRVELAVEDTGIGIPGDAGDRVFEPFYRAAGNPERGDFASTGLGLAVTKRLVEGHGGHISYESDPGRGTIFTLTLRVARRRRPRTRTPAGVEARRSDAAGRGAHATRR